MKKTTRILSSILTLATLLIATTVCGFAENSKATIYNTTEEKSKISQPPNHPAVFNKTKIEEMLTMSPATLDNLGIVARDLTQIGVPSFQAHILVNSKFDPAQVNAYLQSIGSSKRVSVVKALGTCSCGVSVNTGVTVDGNANQKFHSSVAISSIADSVIKSRGIARAVFGYESAGSMTSYINSNYFLFGEHDCVQGITHEGIDVRFTNNDHETFRTLTGGKIMAVNMSALGFGTLTIKHPTEAKHIIFLHADSYIPAVQLNASILGSTFIGSQGGRVGLNANKLTHHVHIEATSTSKLRPSDDKNATLESVAPYASLWSFVATEYR